MIGFCNLFHLFVPMFVRIVSSFTEILRNTLAREPEQRSIEELYGLQTVREKLIKRINSGLLRKEEHYTIAIDACSQKFGCVLRQKQSNIYDGLIEYWSEVLSKDDWNLNTNNQEWSIDVLVILLLCPYLKSTELTGTSL